MLILNPVQSALDLSQSKRPITVYLGPSSVPDLLLFLCLLCQGVHEDSPGRDIQEDSETGGEPGAGHGGEQGAWCHEWE